MNSVSVEEEQGFLIVKQDLLIVVFFVFTKAPIVPLFFSSPPSVNIAMGVLRL